MSSQNGLIEHWWHIPLVHSDWDAPLIPVSDVMRGRIAGMQLTQHVVVIKYIITRWGVLMLPTFRYIVQVVAMVRTDAGADLGLGVEVVGAGGGSARITHHTGYRTVTGVGIMR